MAKQPGANQVLDSYSYNPRGSPSPRPSPSGRGSMQGRFYPIITWRFSPLGGRRFSLSRRERAGVRGKTMIENKSAKNRFASEPTVRRRAVPTEREIPFLKSNGHRPTMRRTSARTCSTETGSTRPERISSRRRIASAVQSCSISSASAASRLSTSLSASSALDAGGSRIASSASSSNVSGIK